MVARDVDGQTVIVLLGLMVAGVTMLALAYSHRSASRARGAGLAYAIRSDEVFLDWIAEGDASRVNQRHILDVHTHFDPTSITGHAAAMSFVVGVLFDYAEAHARSRVDAAVQVRDGCAVVSVCDDGSGVSCADRRDFLERSDDFASIVRAHRGRVDVTETPRGSAVVITLPGAWIRSEPDGPWF